MDDFLWVEKYRPRKVSECILPPRLKNVFQKYVDDGMIPNLMLTGPAGVGKTSVAKAMCSEIGLDHIAINGSEERGIDILRNKIKNYASTMSLMGGRKVIIVDEADYLTPDMQAGLRGVIEEFADNCTFIFTCNFKARIIDAIHSRCSVIDFRLVNVHEKQKMAALFFRRICDILKLENVKFEESILAKIVEKHFPDYRRTLNELQRFAAFGSIDAGTLAQLADIRNLSELIKALKGKDFNAMRKWVVANSDVDPARIFRNIYDSVSEYLKPHSVPQAVMIVAKYQYQAAFVADQEINMVAMLTEMMVDCEYA